MFQVNRKDLLTELALLQLVAEKRGTIPALAYLRFDFSGETLTITGTDMDTSLTTTLAASGEAWAGCLASKQLHELVKLLSDEDLQFIPKDNGRVQIGKGKSKHVLSTIAIDEFPAVDAVNISTLTIDGKTLRVAVERALVCVGDNKDQHWMQGVAFRSKDGKLSVAGTNSAQFAVSEIASEIFADCIVPTKAVQALVRIIGDEPLELGFSNNHAMIIQGSRRITTRLLDAKFPDWNHFIPPSFAHRIVLDPEATQLAFKRACVLSDSVSEVRRPVKFSISKSELTIESRESDSGHSVESVAIDCPTLNGEVLTRGVNGHHFISFLNPETKPFIVFNDDLFCFQLGYEGEPDYRYVTMPLRV